MFLLLGNTKLFKVVGYMVYNLLPNGSEKRKLFVLHMQLFWKFENVSKSIIILKKDC